MLIPLGLVILGGLVAGVIGAIALLSNLAIARRPMSPGIKIAAMIGIIFVAYMAVIVIGAILYAATHKA